MRVTYQEALQDVLAAIAAGEDAAAALAAFPEYAADLREDVRIGETLRHAGSVASTPSQAVRQAASRRLNAQLQSERDRTGGRLPSPAPAWTVRVALAVAVVALAVVGALLLTRDDGSVEAAMIEGVVVENVGGALTVQTQDALEHVIVSDEALVSDASGAAIAIESIMAGQVVRAEVERRADRAVARQVQRSVESLTEWCEGAAERCRTLTDRLERSGRLCDRAEDGCDVTVERLDELREAAAATARLEALKQACLAREPAACRSLVVFCRQAPGMCAVTDDVLFDDVTEAVERLRELTQRCEGGEAAACQRLAQACNQYPALCPDSTQLRPTQTPQPTSPPARAAPAGPTNPPARPLLTEPTLTSEPTQGRDQTSVPAPADRLQPTSTPDRPPTSAPARPR